MTEIWCVRHGETAWNLEKRLQGWQDIALNQTGQQQALQLAQRLALESNFAAIYSSDLQRAQHTAQTCAQALKLTLQIEPRLRERNFGVLEGLKYTEFKAQQPHAAEVWEKREPDASLELGEPLGLFKDRIAQTLNQLASRHKAQKIVIVTHGGALDIIWRLSTNIALNAPRTVKLRNTSINIVTIDQDQQWKLNLWDDIQHLSLDAGDEVQDLIPNA